MFCLSNIIPAHPSLLSSSWFTGDDNIQDHIEAKSIKWANTSVYDLLKERSDPTFLKIPSIALCRTILCVMNGSVPPGPVLRGS